MQSKDTERSNGIPKVLVSADLPDIFYSFALGGARRIQTRSVQ
jgi:hypothetical protein